MFISFELFRFCGRNKVNVGLFSLFELIGLFPFHQLAFVFLDIINMDELSGEQVVCMEFRFRIKVERQLAVFYFDFAYQTASAAGCLCSVVT